MVQIGFTFAESESVWNRSLQFANIMRRLAVQGVRRASQIGVRSYDFKAVDPAISEQRTISLIDARDQINLILDLYLRGIHIHRGQ